MTPHPLSQSRQMAATIRFIAEHKHTVAPRAQSVGVDPLSSTDTNSTPAIPFSFDLGGGVNGPDAPSVNVLAGDGDVVIYSTNLVPANPIQSRSLAAGAGDPANLPAASASQGGGLCDVQRPFHGERYDNLA